MIAEVVVFRATNGQMKTLLIKYLVLMILPALLLACSRGVPSSPERVTLEGSLAMVGNVPFTKLVFRASDGKGYEVAPAEARDLSVYQGKKLIIEGNVQAGELKTADGKYKRIFYTIKNVKVIKSDR